jgi:SAM-dependent methyltransferase
MDCPACHGTAKRLGFAIGNHPLWRCASCRMEFLHPQPDETERAGIYGRRYYDAWGLNMDGQAVRRMKVRHFKKLLSGIGDAIPPGARVLDVGCATGFFLEAANEAGFEPFGVELSGYGAEVCRGKFGSGRIHQGVLETAAFGECPDHRVDAVFMSDLLEHVGDPPGKLREARRWLSPGGRLVVTTPDAGSWSHDLFGRRWVHYKPEHLFYFGTKSLVSLLAGAGFEATAFWSATKYLSLRYARHQLTAFGQIGGLLGRWIDRLPAGILDGQLPVKLGEVTVMAKAI